MNDGDSRILDVADDLVFFLPLGAARVGDGKSGAVFNEADVVAATHRYLLWRVWESSKPLLVWVLLNPSTATHEVLDPTVRRCIGWAKRGDFGGVVILNAYAYRATEPKDMLASADRIDGGNDIALGIVLTTLMSEPVKCTCDRGSSPVDGGGVTHMPCNGLGWRHPRTIVAWGNGIEPERENAMRKLLRDMSGLIVPLCLGRTMQGSPRHPVRLAYGVQLEEWPL